jgi:predicted dehydrogenase
MAREVGIGLLGVGWMGELHTASYRRVRDHYPDCGGVARLVVAADEVEERARGAVERLGYEQWTSDWREVLAHPDVEAVSITAPNHLHREMAVAAARAGKHFWGEKPLGRDPAETLEAAEAALAAGVRTIVGLNYRHVPAVRYARSLVEAGRLGRVRHFRSQFLASYASHPLGALSWRFSRDLAGYGVLLDLMSHEVDLAQFVLGPIARVTARSATLIRERPTVAAGTGTHFSLADGGELGPVENEDWVAALVEFESGLCATLEASRVAVGPEARYCFEINGADGAVAWNFERMNELELFLPLPTGDRGYASVYMGPAHPEFARFQPGAGIAMGYADLKVIEAHLFLESVTDGIQREPGVMEMASTARVLAAMARSLGSEAWEAVGIDRVPAHES